MAKLTPQPHVEKDPKSDPFIYLGPPSEAFTRCEQTFVVEIDEMLWPDHQPMTAADVRDAISRWMNPRAPQITVEELED